jgi:hypothetical protein
MNEPMNHGLTDFNLTLPPIQQLKRYDGIEIEAMGCYEGNCIERIDEVEMGKDPKATYFWSVYLRHDFEHPANAGFGGAQCVGDFPTKAQAATFAMWLQSALTWAHNQTSEMLTKGATA